MYKYKDGIYFLPYKKSFVKNKTISFNKVLTKEYAIIDAKRIGHITGLVCANQLQLTTQHPATIEIVPQGETI